MSNPVEKKLYSAAKKGLVSVVSSLLRDHPDMVNWADDDQETALHIASYEGHVEVVKLLLAHPAIGVNLKNVDGATPFSFACEHGKVSVVRVMLRILVSISHLMTTRAALHCGGHLVMASMK